MNILGFNSHTHIRNIWKFAEKFFLMKRSGISSFVSLEERVVASALQSGLGVNGRLCKDLESEKWNVSATKCLNHRVYEGPLILAQNLSSFPGEIIAWDAGHEGHIFPLEVGFFKKEINADMWRTEKLSQNHCEFEWHGYNLKQESGSTWENFCSALAFPISWK